MVAAPLFAPALPSRPSLVTARIARLTHLGPLGERGVNAANPVVEGHRQDQGVVMWLKMVAAHLFALILTTRPGPATAKIARLTHPGPLGEDGEYAANPVVEGHR